MKPYMKQLAAMLGMVDDTYIKVPKWEGRLVWPSASKGTLMHHSPKSLERAARRRGDVSPRQQRKARREINRRRKQG